MDRKLFENTERIMNMNTKTTSFEDILTVYSFIKALASENGDLRTGLEGMHFIIQQNLTDVNKKLWFKASDGSIDFGKGVAKDATFTFSCTLPVLAELVTGSSDLATVQMSGEIDFDDFRDLQDNLDHVLAFQEILELANNDFYNLFY